MVKMPVLRLLFLLDAVSLLFHGTPFRGSKVPCCYWSTEDTLRQGSWSLSSSVDGFTELQFGGHSAETFVRDL